MEERLKQVEIKVTYLERLHDTLNKVVFEQQRQIDRLEEKLRWLEGQAPGAAANEPPPHY
jgi:SlyX protein